MIKAELANIYPSEEDLHLNLWLDNRSNES